jgi:ATP-binding cassette subfamily B protein
MRQLSIEQVSFRYPASSVDALDRVTLRLDAGQLVVVVGRSGAGKSTIVKLLTGLYPPTTGRVLVDGVPIDAPADFRDLGSRIGVVTQETQLFAGTIRENLRLVKPTATDAECLAALESAAAVNILQRGTRGLDFVVGEGGAGLSGGERQRISIARALLPQPQILLFDETTSMLDAVTEREIVETIERLTSAPGTMRLTLMVSHRIRAAATAHRIYVMDQGKVVDEGIHEELLQRPGIYAELWRAHEHQVNLSESTNRWNA